MLTQSGIQLHGCNLTDSHSRDCPPRLEANKAIKSIFEDVHNDHPDLAAALDALSQDCEELGLGEQLAIKRVASGVIS